MFTINKIIPVSIALIYSTHSISEYVKKFISSISLIHTIYTRYICQLCIDLGNFVANLWKIKEFFSLDLLRKHEVFMHLDQSCLLEIIMVDESWFL
jgi:hypothetical protein